MIQLESICKSYPNGTLFTNVNIYIKKGMRIGLVGQNGSGKTTLLRLMLGEERQDSGNISSFINSYQEGKKKHKRIIQIYLNPYI